MSRRCPHAHRACHTHGDAQGPSQAPSGGRRPCRSPRAHLLSPRFVDRTRRWSEVWWAWFCPEGVGLGEVVRRLAGLESVKRRRRGTLVTWRKAGRDNREREKTRGPEGAGELCVSRLPPPLDLPAAGNLCHQ